MFRLKKTFEQRSSFFPPRYRNSDVEGVLHYAVILETMRRSELRCMATIIIKCIFLSTHWCLNRLMEVYLNQSPSHINMMEENLIIFEYNKIDKLLLTDFPII